MAAQEVSRNHETRHCVFAIDSEQDLASLPTDTRDGMGEMRNSGPCRQGSVACALDGMNFMLDGRGQWVVAASGSGGGSAPGLVLGAIPEPQIRSLF